MRRALPGPRAWAWAARLTFGLLLGSLSIRATVDVSLTGVPDYEWYEACFGTATGNLIGFWDRHGLPDLYTGPTAGGEAPLDSRGANYGIRSLWASKAGRDGRPASEPGHDDDYYVAYESTKEDPYKTAGRAEHAPDCIGDFIGMNQRKWTNQDGECDGNIDGFSFVYWEKSGERRVNFTPSATAGKPPRDIQSGLREFARYRGYEADTFTQLSEFNTERTSPNTGFTFADLKAEIDAGYPMLVFLQDWNVKSRRVGGMPHMNPEIHGMMVIGYYIDDSGTEFARIRDSWATSYAHPLRPWGPYNWTPSLPDFLPVRGVIGFRPKPRITAIERQDGQMTLRWTGPAAELHDATTFETRPAHWYVVEQSGTLDDAGFAPVAPPTTDRQITIPDCCPGTGFFRLKIVPAPN